MQHCTIYLQYLQTPHPLHTHFCRCTTSTTTTMREPRFNNIYHTCRHQPAETVQARIPTHASYMHSTSPNGSNQVMAIQRACRIQHHHEPKQRAHAACQAVATLASRRSKIRTLIFFFPSPDIMIDCWGAMLYTRGKNNDQTGWRSRR